MERILLTNSSIACFKSCRKKYQFSYVLGIRPCYDAKALRMGTAVHAGLDCLKKGMHVDLALAVVRDCYLVMPESFDANDWQIECETAVALVNGYAWRWSAPMTVVASEQSWNLRLLNPETNSPSTVFDIAGKMDGIIKMEDGRLAVLEHKTCSEDIGLESDYWRRLQLDHQITLYVYAARQLGHAVATVLYDVIRKPTIKPNAVAVCDDLGAKIVLGPDGQRVRTERGQWRQSGDSAKGYVVQTRAMLPDEWSKKLTTDIGERYDFYFCRREIPRLDTDIEECISELWDTQKIIRDAMNQNRWYKTVSKNTCDFCPYWGLCSSRYDPSDTLPEGFIRVTDFHPELKEESNASTSTTKSSSTSEAIAVAYSEW